MTKSELVAPYRVIGKQFQLSDIDPSEVGTSRLDKGSVRPLLEEGVARLIKLQERLYAEHRWGVLIILQGMDTSGKDGVIKHVMSGVNPLGCIAHSFKAPTQFELDHDFLRRAQMALPRRGHIGIFNRSYYEEVLVTRVHREMLLAEGLPETLVTDGIWQQRYQDIVAFERYLVRNGIVPVKVFLHISKSEQRKRLLARINDPEKQWKFAASDVDDRQYWGQYQAAYEDAIRHTAMPHAPWHVIPADHKWFARLVVVEAVIEAMSRINPQLPALTASAKTELDEARTALEAED
jgi:PPK2 family polyphosphate:nucleotide phosphotransferase